MINRTLLALAVSSFALSGCIDISSSSNPGGDQLSAGGGSQSTPAGSYAGTVGMIVLPSESDRAGHTVTAIDSTNNLIYVGSARVSGQGFEGGLFRYQMVQGYSTGFHRLAVSNGATVLATDFTPRSRIAGAIVDPTDSSRTRSINQSYLPLSEAQVSLNTLSANLSGSNSSETDFIAFNLDTLSGAVTGQDSQGCSYTGEIRQPDPVLNLFAVELDALCPSNAIHPSGVVYESGPLDGALIVAENGDIILHLASSNRAHAYILQPRPFTPPVGDIGQGPAPVVESEMSDESNEQEGATI